MLFSLWAVSASSNFSVPVSDFTTKQSSQRARFFNCIPPRAFRFGFFVYGITARLLLVGRGRCLCLLGGYVTRPPNQGYLILLSNYRLPFEFKFPTELAVAMGVYVLSTRRIRCSQPTSQ